MILHERIEILQLISIKALQKLHQPEVTYIYVKSTECFVTESDLEKQSSGVVPSKNEPKQKI